VVHLTSARLTVPEATNVFFTELDFRMQRSTVEKHWRPMAASPGAAACSSMIPPDVRHVTLLFVSLGSMERPAPFRLRWLISLVGPPHWVEGATSEGAGRYVLPVSRCRVVRSIWGWTPVRTQSRWDFAPGEMSSDTEKIIDDEASIRRLIARFEDLGQLRVCLRGGPNGVGLYLLLTSMGVACQVVAPSLVPCLPGDRVKTDRRDCRRLAGLGS
jgi:hypothetical protein